MKFTTFLRVAGFLFVVGIVEALEDCWQAADCL